MKTQVFLLACVCALITGCSTFTKPNGQTVKDVDPAKVDAATAVVSTAVSTVPGWGTVIGGLVALVGAAIAAHYRGKEVGWTEATGTPAVPAVPGEAKIS